MSTGAAEETLHATTVAINGRGVLILGASGAGKSALGLQLMALGAQLVADDRTVIRKKGASVVADAPPTLRNMIEARGVGILNATAAGPTPLCVVIDLDQAETDRLPHPRMRTFLNRPLPCLHKADSPAWPAAILQYVKGGSVEI